MPNEEKINKITAIWYSVSQGLSTGASTFASIISKTQKSIAAMAAGAAFVADTTASYFFQGKAMQKPDNDKDRSAYVPINNAINDTHLESQMTASGQSHRQTLLSITSQLGYLTLDASKNFANRYFLLITLYNIFNNEEFDNDASASASTGIILLFVTGLIIKQAFVMTNETYETTEAIAKKFTNDETSKPFYATLFKPLAKQPRVIKAFKIIGSVDHVLGDDLAPMIALLPKEAIYYLATHAAAKYSVIALAGLIGAPMAILIYCQTYLFEASHTEENLQAIYGELISSDASDVPKKLLEVLQKTINIMGPVHGLATSASVFVTFRNLIDNAYAKWIVSTGAGVFVLLGTGIGVHKSEVKEADEHLMELIRAQP